MPRFACWLLLVLGAVPHASAATIDFEDLSLAQNSYFSGPDHNGFNRAAAFGSTERVGSFTTGGATFNNIYNLDFGSWSGWAYSNVTDVTTAGFGNQYSAYNLPGGGGDASANYAVAYDASPGDSVITLPAGFRPQSVRITNGTYAALSMLDGDAFAKKFGGVSGNDPDFLLLTITGKDSANQPVGSIDFYLADYRFADNSQDYIVNHWTTVDLSSLAGATTLSFAMASSDVGQFGINTPTYLAIDNLLTQPAPEPASFALLVLAIPITLSWAQRRRWRRPVIRVGDLS